MEPPDRANPPVVPGILKRRPRALVGGLRSGQSTAYCLQVNLWMSGTANEIVKITSMNTRSLV